jgi:hypothetical protein
VLSLLEFSTNCGYGLGTGFFIDALTSSTTFIAAPKTKEKKLHYGGFIINKHKLILAWTRIVLTADEKMETY